MYFDFEHWLNLYQQLLHLLRCVIVSRIESADMIFDTYKDNVGAICLHAANWMSFISNWRSKYILEKRYVYFSDILYIPHSSRAADTFEIRWIMWTNWSKICASFPRELSINRYALSVVCKVYTHKHCCNLTVNYSWFEGK